MLRIGLLRLPKKWQARLPLLIGRLAMTWCLDKVKNYVLKYLTDEKNS